MSHIDPTSARSLIAADPYVLVVDVRTPAEFESAHIDGAVNLPLDQVDAHLRRIVTSAGGRMLLICQSGNRAERARTALAGAGLADVAVLDGGMNAWIAAGGPVNRGRPRWALERQVRLVAGSIVFTAAVAGFWVPAAALVAAFIGGGLTVAALTNTCTMGLLLSKLPYNRVGGADVEAAIARLRGGRSSADAVVRQRGA
ncbi:rhodanese-like domain-containing protein [Nonomuraea basaltis]|uniref:rhodanese-like domain-containing protein n=1 Tax=Nonomuraea basaltis TaxID=2495887 RepID=UPI00110C6B2F|nr:rhodanese-like domain-containing protein [Nonomuraea basaltis]TMS00597.1 rhodanese-like domain-containing protein [Nonomuraea basaltis]